MEEKATASKKQSKNTIVNAAEWVVVIFATAIIAYLMILVLLFSFNTTNSIPTQTNIFTQLGFAALIIGTGWLLGHFLNPYPQICKWVSGVFFAVTLVVVGMLCLSYVSETLIWPSSDERSCFDIAKRFYQSEFGAVVPEGSYLSLWPFQTGLIFILEKTMRLFQDTSPLLFQKINCLYILMIIASGYGIVCSMTKKLEGRILYLFLMATYCQLIFRVTEVYGDLPAMAWMMFSSMCFMVFHKIEKKWSKITLACLFAGAAIIACVYKRNCVIFVIAFLLVEAVLQIQKWNVGFALVVIATVVLSIDSGSLTQKYYEHYAGNICGKGVPAIAYIAMGLQYNGEEPIPGGWNGFHSRTYMETGYDYDETVRLSKESINNSLQDFVESPAYLLHFFHNKVLKQWANQTHGIYWSVNSYFDTTRNPEAFWVRYLEGVQYQKLVPFQDKHESVVYVILFLACCTLVWAKVKKRRIEFYYLLPFVTFIGGFLFSLIWEGQTDAVMYYPILVLPVAIGLICLHMKKLKSMKE